jgi:hypothetical protein
MALVDLGDLLTGLASSLALTESDLTGVLGVDARTLDRWCKGESYPQREARVRIERLSAFNERIHDTFSDDGAIHAWMTTDSRYLGGLKPTEVARAGRLDRVEAALEALNSGVFI